MIIDLLTAHHFEVRMCFIYILIAIKTINGKSYKNTESYKISNINVSRIAAIIRLKD